MFNTLPNSNNDELEPITDCDCCDGECDCGDCAKCGGEKSGPTDIDADDENYINEYSDGNAEIDSSMYGRASESDSGNDDDYN